MHKSERLPLDTAAVLGITSEKRDACTAGHQVRVTILALGIAAHGLNAVVEELKAGRKKKYDAGVVDACIAELHTGLYQPA